MAESMTLNPDFLEFIELLNANEVRYLIVGGYAVVYHGYIRTTKDIDIWLEMTAENADRAVKAIEQFGLASFGLQASDFSEPDQIVQLGYPPRRIDILTTIPGVNFDECYAARVETTLDGVRTYFIDVESLKKNKQATGRPQDLADVDQLL